MFTVTLHFPHEDWTEVELPALPRRGDSFVWYDENGVDTSNWVVTDIQWSAGHPTMPTQFSVNLDPEDEATVGLILKGTEERIARARARAEAADPTMPARGEAASGERMTAEEAAALIERWPDLAPLGPDWVRNLADCGYRALQMEALVRHLRDESSSA